MVGKNKKDFIGKRSFTRSDTSKKNRKQLVGVLPLNKSQSIEEGEHILEINELPANIKDPIKYLGHITSSYHSPNLEHYISMAMLENGNELIGREMYVTTSSGTKNIPIKIVKPIFIDPENKRLFS